MSKRVAKPVVVDPVAAVEAEIRDLDSRITVVADEHAAAEQRLDDDSWRIAETVLRQLRAKRLALKEKRLNLLAGIDVEEKPAAPQTKHVLQGLHIYARAPEAKDGETEEQKNDRLFAQRIDGAVDAMIVGAKFSPAMLESPPSLKSTLYLLIGLQTALKERFQRTDAAAEDVAERLDAIETGGIVGVRYFGVWQRQVCYPAGALATHKGGLWHANVEATGVEPGDGNKMWTLSAKAGEMPVVSAASKVVKP